jgi:WD40 repeat protein
MARDPQLLDRELTPSSTTWLALTAPDYDWAAPQAAVPTTVADELEDELPETAALSAARALANVASDLAEPTQSNERLQGAAEHCSRARLVSAGSSGAFADAIYASASGPVSSVVQRLDTMSVECAGFLALLAFELAGQRPQTVDAVVVPVLFDRHRLGGSGDLTLRLLAVGPPGLHPDPSLMSFLATDDGFVGALRRAWELSPYGSSKRCVVWAVTDQGDPCNDMQDASLGAAFAVALDELARRSRRLYGKYGLRKLDGRCAVTGAIGARGVLLPVGGYPNKLSAAHSRKLRRVVVPRASRDASHDELQPPAGLRVEYARDTKAAAQLARRQVNPRFVAVALAFILLLTAGLIGVGASRAHAHTESLRVAAAQVAGTATDLAGGDEQTGLLLAMASDDLARAAGEKTHTFETLAGSVGTLVKVYRPPTGRYAKAAIAADGRTAMLGTDAGRVDIFSTQTGARVWSRSFSPGMVLAPGQVYINAMALANDSRRAAYATTDGDVRLLSFDDVAGWAETDTWSVPAPQRGLLGVRNTPDALSFSSDGSQLTAVGSGVVTYDVSAGRLAVSRSCPGLSGGLAPAAGHDVLLTSETQVSHLAPSSCAAEPLLAVPPGTQVRGAYQRAGQPVRVIAQTGNSLQLYRPGEQATTITDQPSLSNIQVMPADDVVTAKAQFDTVAWHAESGRQIFRYHLLGVVVLALDHLVIAHDGGVEVHRLGPGFGLAHSLDTPDVWRVAWAGSDHLLVGQFNGLVHVQHPATGTSQSVVLPGSSGTADSVAGTSDGNYAAAAIRGNRTTGSLGVWDLRTNQQMSVPQRPGTHANAVAFAGSELLVGYASGGVSEMAESGGRWVEKPHMSLAGYVLQVCPGRTGQFYVLSAESTQGPATLTVIDGVGSGPLHKAASVVLPEVNTGVLAPLSDGGVALATGTGTLRTYDTRLQPVRQPVETNVNPVFALVEIPGQDELLTVGRFQHAVVRKSSMTAESGDAWRLVGSIITVAQSPDGRYLATYNFDRSQLSVWSVTERDLRTRACSAIGRNLTPAEWRQYVRKGVSYRKVCASLGDDRPLSSGSYGALPFGATPAVAAETLGEPLTLRSASVEGGCRVGDSPAAPDVHFAVADGRLVAAMATSSATPTSAGFRVGDSSKELQSRLKGKLQSRPYSTDGSTIEYDYEPDPGSALVFLTDTATNRITFVLGGDRSHVEGVGYLCA